MAYLIIVPQPSIRQNRTLQKNVDSLLLECSSGNILYITSIIMTLHRKVEARSFPEKELIAEFIAETW